MTLLRKHLEEYVTLRRQLGFKFPRAGVLLKNFVRFAEQEDASFITTKLALRWATQPTNVAPSQHADRLSIVRQFAAYLSGVDSRTEVPPQRLLPYHSHRRTPQLYRDADVPRLLNAARQIESREGLDGATYSTLFGLLAVTGMRVGETVSLESKDVDFDQALLTLRQTKGDKSRLIPVHASTAQALRRYAALRDQKCPQPSSPRFFLSERGTCLSYWDVNHCFLSLARQIGLRGPPGCRGVRLHDLRHRFAIRTLENWYRSSTNAEKHLPELATYLGHVHVRYTYWYLSATPTLLQLATRRLQRGERFI